MREDIYWKRRTWGLQFVLPKVTHQAPRTKPVCRFLWLRKQTQRETTLYIFRHYRKKQISNRVTYLNRNDIVNKFFLLKEESPNVANGRPSAIDPMIKEDACRLVMDEPAYTPITIMTQWKHGHANPKTLYLWEADRRSQVWGGVRIIIAGCADQNRWTHWWICLGSSKIAYASSDYLVQWGFVLHQTTPHTME